MNLIIIQNRRFLLFIVFVSLIVSCKKQDAVIALDAESAEIQDLLPENMEEAEGMNYLQMPGVDSDTDQEKISCFPKEESEVVLAQVEENIRHLLKSGTIKEANSRSRVLFSWPLKKTSGLRDPGYYSITNYVDHNASSPNRILDYNCGNRSYDTGSGYNHQGTDILIWPFEWDKMDRKQVQVIAAASGTIVHKSDGYYDKNCGANNSYGNGIVVRHSDGSKAIYWHLKRNSLTSKRIGSRVSTGEFLGFVGSSGSSTGPHLHFEVHDRNNKVIDPFGGSCNRANGRTSWWKNQKLYTDSGLNALKTHSRWPVFQSCNQKAIKYEKSDFRRGARVYLVGYFRHQLAGRKSNWKLIQPDGRIYWSWEYTPGEGNQPNFAAIWWRGRSVKLSNNAQRGTWKFQITHMGKTNTHRFKVQ